MISDLLHDVNDKEPAIPYMFCWPTDLSCMRRYESSPSNSLVALRSRSVWGVPTVLEVLFFSCTSGKPCQHKSEFLCFLDMISSTLTSNVKVCFGDFLTSQGGCFSVAL